MQHGRVIERLTVDDLVAGRISETHTGNLILASQGFTREDPFAI
jgi:hypothetical protein